MYLTIVVVCFFR